MSEQRDPQLEALFDAARNELAHDPFVNKVMADIERRKRRVVLGWFVAAMPEARRNGTASFARIPPRAKVADCATSCSTASGKAPV